MYDSPHKPHRESHPHNYTPSHNHNLSSNHSHTCTRNCEHTLAYPPPHTHTHTHTQELEFGCGRVMCDVSSMFIVYLLELHQWHSNFTRVQQVLTDLWPNAKRAAQWHLDRAAATGLPQYLVTTYDVVQLAAYPYSSYSSAFHLLAMKAAEKLAVVMGECRNSVSVSPESVWVL